MTKRTKPIFCTVSIILTILMAFLLPTQVFASTVSGQKKTKAEKFDSLVAKNKNANIISEIKEKRDEYTKHFRMDDGTIMAVRYDYPIHYKSQKGKWLNLDNSLVAETPATSDEAEKAELYKTKNGNVDITFTANTNSNNLINLSSKTGNISWKYKGVKNVSANIKNNNKKHKGNKRFTSTDKLSSKAIYKSIYKGVDLECLTSTLGVKENVILKNAKAKNEFEIEYNIKGFKAKQTDEHTIKLYKGKKVIYTINAPYMYDSENKISTDISLKIISNKSNILTVKLTADKSYLNNAKYPVTIDPETTLIGSANTETTYVIDSEPDTAKAQSTSFSIGKSENLQTHVISNMFGLVKCKNIVNDFADKNIVSANLNLFPMSYSTEMEIEAFPITSSWTRSTATFNNVTYDSEVIDYSNTEENSQDSISFDITKVFKKWANGSLDNNGIYLKSNDNYTIFGGYQCYFSNKRPTFVVKYKEFTGLENGLTSHTVDCGQDAQLSVCDYTGSLSVKQNFFEEKAARLPLNIYAIYHSKRNSVNENTGYGWHYSFHQTITQDDNYYIYNDADGVDHYFKKIDGETNLSDEDDLGYTLKINDTNLKINNGSSTQKYETVENSDIYRLKTETDNDNDNNVNTYTYNSNGKLTTIHTSLGDYILQWASGVIANVKTPSGKYMYFVYYSGTSKIARFTAIDGRSSTFNYTSYADSGLLNEVRYYYDSSTSVVGGGVNCTYYSNNKVKKITEIGKNGASRKALEITYNNDNTTEFTDVDNNTETYTFDNYGNTVSVLNANGYITNENNSGSLGIATGADSHTKNYLGESNEPSSIRTVQPYVTEQYYAYAEELDGVRSDCGTVTIDNTVSYLGSKSIKVKNTGSSQFFTVAKYQKRIEDLAGKKVTLSSYVKLKDIEKGNKTGNWGAVLRIEAYKRPGPKALDVFSPAVIENLPSSDWQRVSVTATIPEECSGYYYEVSFGLKNAQGEAWFDCMQLEKSATANDYNILADNDFSTSSNYSQNNFWKDKDGNNITTTDGKYNIVGLGGEFNDSSSELEEGNTEPTVATYTQIETETFENDVVEETDSYGNVTKTVKGEGTRTYKRTYEATEAPENTENTEPTTADSTESTETSEPETTTSTEPVDEHDNFIYQEVAIGKKNVSFVASGKAKAQSVPLNSDSRTFGIALKITYANGEKESHYEPFNAYTDSWQSVMMSVVPEKPQSVIEKVAFAFVYGYNKNTMTVKNASLSFADNYDTTSSNDGSSSSSNNSNEAINEEIISESIDNSKLHIETSSTYDSETHNYAVSKVDEAGNTVLYSYDGDGNTTSITDGEGNVTSYTYDTHNNITSVANGQASYTTTFNQYGKVSEIANGNTHYTFEYNNYEDLTKIKVGSQTLVEYGYDSSGKLTSILYGNNQVIRYEYDSYSRIIKVYDDDDDIATYTYNKKGAIAKSYDVASEQTTVYNYDCNGNLVLRYAQTSNNKLLYGLSSDENGNLVEKTYVNGELIEIKEKDDSREYKIDGNNKVSVDTVTDNLGRTEYVDTKYSDGNNTNTAFHTEYDYITNNTSKKTTNIVSQLSQSYGNSYSTVYDYEYDSNNNITKVKVDDVTVQKFTYDDLNQLETSADKNSGKYTEYEYDHSGNITSVKEYSLTSTLGKGTLQNTNSYSYGDTNWGDKLTSYNNQTITYDNIGNPLSYRDNMSMEWSQGRQLKKITKSGSDIEFKYNADGLRTEKHCGNNTVKYFYDNNNNMIEMKYNDTLVYFYYDNYGNVTSMAMNGDEYFYVKNLQGDVEKIIDKTGHVAAVYKYNAWGKIVDIQDETNINIAEINPFRYRSYIYDEETDLYYLRSRYYDSVIGRFLNEDSPEFTDSHSGAPLSTNMFAYCENNSVNSIDPTGHWVFSFGIEAGASFVFGAYVAFGVAFSNKSVALTFSIGLLIMTNAAAYIEGYAAFYPTKTSVDHLSGWGVSIGASVSIGFRASLGGAGEFQYKGHGISLSGGYGISMAPIPTLHVKFGHTWVEKFTIKKLKNGKSYILHHNWIPNSKVKVTKKGNYINIYIYYLKKTVRIYYKSKKTKLY